jgi:hypothetical protein
VLGLLPQKTWLQVHYLQSITITRDPAETQPAVRNHMAVETSLLAQASTRQHKPTVGSTLAPTLLPKRRAVYKSQVAKQTEAAIVEIPRPAHSDAKLTHCLPNAK